MKKVILIGFFSECVELCEKSGFKILGYVDKCNYFNNYNYLGNDDYFIKNKQKYLSNNLFLVPDSPSLRKRLYSKYTSEGFSFATVISPNAIISKTAVIGEGCMIQDGCNISSNVILEKCVRINSMANVMHDVSVSDFSVVAPSAVLLGHVKVNNEAYIGANATILPNLSVGEKSIVGAGAVVTKDVDNEVVVAGIPAHILKKA